MANNVPLTIQTPMSGNLASRIVIGSNQLAIDQNLRNVYWFVILDRSDLSVKANFTTTTNNAVPSQLSPYLNDSKYIMILTTQNLGTGHLPQGALYDFLINEGANRQLNRAEQIFEALNCGNWGWINYVYVAVLGDTSTSGFEYLDLYNSAILTTLHFFPVTIGGQTLYTPAQ